MAPPPVAPNRASSSPSAAVAVAGATSGSSSLRGLELVQRGLLGGRLVLLLLLLLLLLVLFDGLLVGRSSLLMLVSQRTSEEMLGRDGKEKLATDVMDEVSRVLGYEVDTPKPRKAVKVAKADAEDDEEEEVPKRKKSRRSGPPSPVQGVLFSSFIVQ